MHAVKNGLKQENDGPTNRLKYRRSLSKHTNLNEIPCPQSLFIPFNLSLSPLFSLPLHSSRRFSIFSVVYHRHDEQKKYARPKPVKKCKSQIPFKFFSSFH